MKDVMIPPDVFTKRFGPDYWDKEPDERFELLLKAVLPLVQKDELPTLQKPSEKERA